MTNTDNKTIIGAAAFIPFNLSGQNFCALEFQGTNLSERDCSYSWMQHVSFCHVNMENANLAHTRFAGNNYIFNSNISGANFSRIHNACELVLDAQGNLNQEDWGRVVLDHIHQAVGVNFSHASMAGVIINNSLLTDPILKGVKLTNNTEHQLADAILQNVTIELSKNLDLTDGKLGIDWSHVHFTASKPVTIDIRGSDFSSSALSNQTYQENLMSFMRAASHNNIHIVTGIEQKKNLLFQYRPFNFQRPAARMG
ncbi:MAG: pentapeptide repeat-containing protein [Alphaproteobacteria bacterium]